MANGIKFRTAILMASMIITLLSSCKLAPVNETDFIIPNDFELVHHDKEYDEILAVQYNREMDIIVSKNMSLIIKKSAAFGSAMMKQVFDYKAPMLIEKHNGKNLTELEYFFVNEHLYIFQSFDYIEEGGADAYYEYGALFIKDPEEYYEFFITGDKNLQKEHKPVIKKFLEGVR